MIEVPPTLNSGTGVSIVSTDIVTDGVNRDVLASSQSSLFLFFTVAFDLNQISWGNAFIANFQIENYQTGKKTNTYWQAPLTALPQAPYVWLNYWSTAATFFGVDTQGVYLYRPTFTVVVPNPGELPAFIGLSDLAVAEEHFFLVEGYIP